MKLFDLSLSRIIAASPDDVFAAWIDPERFKIWMGSSHILMTPKVDGLFYLGVEHGGRELPHYGRYLRLDRPTLIEHTWMSESTQGRESHVSVGLEPNGAGTQLTLRHTGLPTEAEMTDHLRGWTTIVGRLADRKARLA